jgi:hypothetical protein
VIDERVIKDMAKAMRSPHTPKQLGDAIGAAKEIVEAALRGALGRLGEPWTAKDDLPKLMKKWRDAVGELAPPVEKARTLSIKLKRPWRTS